MNAKHTRENASNAFRASNPTNAATARTKAGASPAAKMTSLVFGGWPGAAHSYARTCPRKRNSG